MTKKDRDVTFKTVEEYRAFYATDTKRRQPKGSKCYRIGADIAKMACEKAINTLPQEQTSQIANFGLEH